MPPSKIDSPSNDLHLVAANDEIDRLAGQRRPYVAPKLTLDHPSAAATGKPLSEAEFVPGPGPTSVGSS